MQQKKHTKYWSCFFYLCSSLAHYEMYGGDVMKRSISNQITTQMSMAYLLHSLSASILHISSLLFGPYPYWLGVTILMSTGGLCAFLSLSQSQIIIFWNFKLHKFAIFCGLNEDFFSWFFLLTNLILAYGTQFGRYVHTIKPFLS